MKSFLLGLALCLVGISATAKEFLVYFGTYTNALSQGIYVSRLDAETGKVSAPELAAYAANPSYLAISPDQKFLYAANSVNSFRDASGKPAGAVSAFRIEGQGGGLTLLNRQSSGGGGPCHVSVDAAGKTVLVANYGGGNVRSLPLEADGRLSEGGSFIQHTGSSVNTNRQNSAHAHWIATEPRNRFVLVCDLGMDAVKVYPFDAATGKLDASRAQGASVPPGGGARHLDFGRDGKTIYVVNELTCAVTRMVLDETGRLAVHETVSALPPGVELQKAFTAAAIAVRPDGRFVYLTIRGHDSVSVLAVAEGSGQLTLVQNVPSGGKVPRGLGIDPTGRWLFAGNQKSDKVAMFRIDEATGKLSATGTELTVGAPVDVRFVARP